MPSAQEGKGTAFSAALPTTRSVCSTRELVRGRRTNRPGLYLLRNTSAQPACHALGTSCQRPVSVAAVYLPPFPSKPERGPLRSVSFRPLSSGSSGAVTPAL